MKKRVFSILLACMLTACTAHCSLAAVQTSAASESQMYAASESQVYAAAENQAYIASESQTYTVTANLMVPGELNTQLPGVTAYMTNGNNPLGEGGYEAKAPTEPVSNNATVVQHSDGTLTLTLPIPNPVFTLQRISGSSNASITDSVRDSATYTSTDGKNVRQGRITKLTIKLNDRSGTYVFNNCVEFPTLLGVDWTVPLTLEVDLSRVPAPTKQAETSKSAASSQSGTAKSDTSSHSGSAKPAIASQGAASSASTNNSAASVNTDKLKAIISTVETAEQEIPVSADGKDVSPSKTWVTQSDMDSLKAALATAKAAASSKNQNTIDAQTAALTAAYQTFVSAQQSGKGEATDHLGKTLKPGKYTISANIWFNKADTGLPLNPHITNSTFPPMNPVEGNAELTIEDDGQAQVVIPICIKDRVMTVRQLHGLNLLDVKQNEEGAITSITVNLGNLSGDSTVVTMQGAEMTADIWMGDLAMTISGLEKEHTWPFTFELNLSGVDTTDGGKMPTVELEMLDSSAAAGAMAAAGVDADELDDEDAQDDAENQSDVSATVVILIIVAIIAVIAGAIIIVKRVRDRKEEKERKENYYEY